MGKASSCVAAIASSSVCMAVCARAVTAVPSVVVTAPSAGKRSAVCSPTPDVGQSARDDVVWQGSSVNGGKVLVTA